MNFRHLISRHVRWRPVNSYRGAIPLHASVSSLIPGFLQFPMRYVGITRLPGTDPPLHFSPGSVPVSTAAIAYTVADRLPPPAECPTHPKMACFAGACSPSLGATFESILAADGLASRTHGHIATPISLV